MLFKSDGNVDSDSYDLDVLDCLSDVVDVVLYVSFSAMAAANVCNYDWLFCEVRHV